MHEFGARAIDGADEARAVAIMNQMQRMRPTTLAHSERVADLAVRVARTVHLPEAQVHAIYWGALMHDVGELHVRRAVLEKPASLAPQEISQIREHTLVGARWLAAVEGLTVLVPFVRWHHERFDGEGYPDARSGQDVPLGVALVGVCDAWDSLTQSRPYREPQPYDDAASELRRCAGRQWSRALVEWTLDCVERSEPVSLD